MISVILVFILLIILALLMIFKTEWVWEFEHRHSVEGGRPTELYLTMVKRYGVFLMIISIICFILYFS